MMLIAARLGQQFMYKSIDLGKIHRRLKCLLLPDLVSSWCLNLLLWVNSSKIVMLIAARLGPQLVLESIGLGKFHRII